jgi:hypothetical protein
MNPNFLVRLIYTAAIPIVLGAGTASSAQAQTAQATPEARYQTIQRGITTLIASMEGFLHDHPNSKQAPIVRIQLNSLKSLQTSAAAVIPVPLNSCRARRSDGHDNEWAVTSVVRESDKTIVTLTVHNTLPNDANAFYAFDRNPLAIVDNKGQFYKMLAVTSEAPAGVVKSQIDGFYAWTLQAGQTIQVTVEFDPIPAGVTGGKVIYKGQNYGDPAVFSLLNPRQSPK